LPRLSDDATHDLSGWHDVTDQASALSRHGKKLVHPPPREDAKYLEAQSF